MATHQVHPFHRPGFWRIHDSSASRRLRDSSRHHSPVSSKPTTRDPGLTRPEGRCYGVAGTTVGSRSSDLTRRTRVVSDSDRGLRCRRSTRGVSQQSRSGLTGTVRGFVMWRPGRSRWFAVSVGLVLVASACNGTGATSATTPEAEPPPVVIPEASAAAQTTARLREPAPLLVTAADGYTAVSAGIDHSCGLRAEGTVICWGDNFEGQLDAPAGAFAAVSSGWDHSCGLRVDGTIVCWGLDSFGGLDAPAGVFVAVSAGSRHSCGLRADETIVCWGFDSFGELDAPAGTFAAVSADIDYSCGLRVEGTIVCWGAS
ncbi:MAG: hypothetical protein F4062_07715, partial [Acidimicrobiia bacterium]|nr:hypothetical protein [Acidimicrobiia bacterium]